MIYWGETHRTWWDRALEHRIALRSDDQSNALAKHMALHHPEEMPNFEYKVDKCHKGSLNRQIREAIMISQENPAMLMNSKSEWGMENSIPRVRVVEDQPPPLDNDEPGNGKPSDHLIIVWKPINHLGDYKPEQKIITYRPMPESGMTQFKLWLQDETWWDLYQEENAHRKADILQNKLLLKLDEYLPQKLLKIRSDDREWVNDDIKCLDRKRKREYSKRKKSPKWEKLNQEFHKKCISL